MSLHEKTMNQEFYNIINQFLANRDKLEVVIMDIGCAEIRAYSEFLLNNSTRYVGLDKNEALIKKAKERFNSDKCELLLENVEDLTMPNESFDIIVCNNMLAYTDQKIVLNKVYELLKNGGLCISFNNNTIEYSLYKMIYPYKPWHKEFPHSLLVVLNTWLYKVSSLRIFRTIYNTIPSLKRILNQHKYKSINIHKTKVGMPYNVINFYYIK